jgi:hypothetical protein
MSLLLAILLYPMPGSLSIVRTNQSLSVTLHSNLLTFTPLYPDTTSGASQTGQELEASSLQSRLERQNHSSKNKLLRTQLRVPERRSPYSAISLSPQAHDRMRSTAGSAPNSPLSPPMDLLNRIESRTN